MSATLIHHNPSLIDALSQAGGGGVSVVTPIMAVSVCRPAIVDGLPSRHGSATARARQTSAKSLPNQGNVRFGAKETNASPLSSSLLSHVSQPHPPPGYTLDNKDGLTLPQIKSPNQLCSSNSQTSIPGDAQNDALIFDQKWIVAPPEKPSAFPNFRALQRLAASAKLRINNLKSKEAKAITAMMAQERQGGATEGKASDDVVLHRYPQGDAENVENSVLNSSWSSQNYESVQQMSNATQSMTAPSENGKKHHTSHISNIKS